MKRFDSEVSALLNGTRPAFTVPLPPLAYSTHCFYVSWCFPILGHRNYSQPCVSARYCAYCCFQVDFSLVLDRSLTPLHWLFTRRLEGSLSSPFSSAFFSTLVLQILNVLISLNFQLSPELWDGRTLLWFPLPALHPVSSLGRKQ